MEIVNDENTSSGNERGQTENSELRAMARASLDGNWGLAIGTFVVFSLVVSAASFIPFGSLLITGPMSVGIALFSINISRNENAELGQIFHGFNKFGVALGAYILSAIFIFLWMLLLIIPGIIAALSYSMVNYIIADEEEIGVMDALNKSKAMMDGYKMKLFLLALSFIGWAILCILTAGIGFLWLIPYIQVTVAKFYDDIKGEKHASFSSDDSILDDTVG
ncbi:MAG: DUF975 family protein [Flavobacteriales bacterium]|nr:DUF975 family protein [Flavobacteriales bacterium]